AEPEDEESLEAEEEDTPVAAVVEKPSKRGKKPAETKEPGAKSKTPMLVGAGAVVLLAAVGGIAIFSRGGSSSEPSTVNAAATDVGGNAALVLGMPGADQNATTGNADVCVVIAGAD